MKKRLYIRGSLATRFWARVNKNGPVHPVLKTRCWLWTGYTSKGYGQFRQPDRTLLRTHRVAWFLATGKWPKYNINHKCDNPTCIRYAHLFDGTQAEGMADMGAKGRAGSTKLTCRKVRHMRQLAAQGQTSGILSMMFGVSCQTVWHIVTRKTWKAA